MVDFFCFVFSSGNMPKSWKELNVHPEVLNGIKSFDFPYLTPVQAYTIPQLLNKKDVAAEAVTGTRYILNSIVL